MANPNNASEMPGATYLSDSPEETWRLGTVIAKTLHKNSVVALVGDLGAGKTEFTKGLVAGLGCDGPVTSPTFAIAHEYAGALFPVFHFDFYRMEDVEEFETCGFEECVGSGVVIAEWADKFAELLPSQTLWIHIGAEMGTYGRETRKISLKHP